MNDLFIESTSKTPEINFIFASGELLISGISVPENSVKFYTPVLDWLKEYAKNPKEKTILNFKLEYMNTSSLYFLYDVLKEVNKIIEPPIVVVNWCYFEDDEGMKESGEDFKAATNFAFNFVELEETEA